MLRGPVGGAYAKPDYRRPKSRGPTVLTSLPVMCTPNASPQCGCRGGFVFFEEDRRGCQGWIIARTMNHHGHMTLLAVQVSAGLRPTVGGAIRRLHY